MDPEPFLLSKEQVGKSVRLVHLLGTAPYRWARRGCDYPLHMEGLKQESWSRSSIAVQLGPLELYLGLLSPKSSCYLLHFLFKDQRDLVM